MFKTPVLLLNFNRPGLTQRVFEVIRKQKPEILYVFADGPREHVPTDYNNCLKVREIIEKQVDWDCDLHTLFNDMNLGCGKGPATAISWFFNNVSEGIIIEDDCLPHPDFFGYCSELLERYRDNDRIMVIGGTTYRDDYPCENSYTFTRYGTMAAWATWKRVWDKFDYYLSGFSRQELMIKLKGHLYSRFEYKNWLGLYDWIAKDHFSSYWDWQLHFIILYNNGIAIRPQKNMISNIGDGPDASHTNYTSHSAFKSNRQVYGCLPLNHPSLIEVDKKRDSVYYKKMYRLPLEKRILKPIFTFLFEGTYGNNRVSSAFLNIYRSMKRFF